jgi:hypothetical protein
MKHIKPGSYLAAVLLLILIYPGFSGSREETTGDFYEVISFYKSNPSDNYRFALYNEEPVIYRIRESVPVLIDRDSFDWNSEESIIFETKEKGEFSATWGDFLQFCRQSSYVPAKGNSLMIGIIRNSGEGGSLEFVYRDSRGSVLSRPLVSGDYEIPVGKPIALEGSLEKGKISPGGKDAGAIRIVGLLEI